MAKEPHKPSEQTPLLRDGTDNESSVANGHARDPEQARHHAEQDDAQEVVLAEEPDTKRLILIFSSVWISVFFAALDTTVVATLTTPIASSFDSLSLLSWIATGYLVANAACQPLSGKLTDIFSRRAGLIFSNIFFGVGTLICGLAPSAPVIIAGRVIAGIGGGGLSCITTFITSDLIPLRRRGLWQGYGNLVFGMGMGLGGIFGGLCADKLTWRWAFLLQLPFILISLILVSIFIDIPVNPSTKPVLSRVDFLGATTLVVSIVFLLLGLNTGGNQLPWSHPLIITSLILSLLSLLLFIYIESTPRWAPEPIIPVLLIARNRTILTACLTNWFSTMSAFLALYYVPLYLLIRGLSPTNAGLRTIPFAVGTSIGSLGTGYIMRSTGKYYYLNLASMTIFVIGGVLISILDLHTADWLTYIYLIPMGLGYGSMLTITLVAMISAASHEFQAVITAASYAFRSTGSTIGITIAGAVYQNILTGRLKDEYGAKDGAEKVIRKIRDNLEYVRGGHLPPGWSVKVVMGMYMEGLRGAFLAGLGLAVLAFVVGLGMREYHLHQNLDRKDSRAQEQGQEEGTGEREDD